MFRGEVILLDAVVAITCVEYSLASELSRNGGDSMLHCTFPMDPTADCETLLNDYIF